MVQIEAVVDRNDLVTNARKALLDELEKEFLDLGALKEKHWHERNMSLTGCTSDYVDPKIPSHFVDTGAWFIFYLCSG